MQPQIRYVESRDGARIAYSTLGSGPPLIVMPVLPATHLDIDWQLPDRREWYTRLAESFTLVRYDGRGSGLSEREVDDLSFEAHVADLGAVVDKLGCESAAILARHIAAPTALTYAADHSSRVSRLVLWNAVPRGADLNKSARNRALRELMEKDWDLYTETSAYASQGWPDTARARQFAAYMRASISQATYRQYMLEFDKVDCTAVLSRVCCPTLVFHRKEVAKMGIDVSKTLAASLPNARLVLAEGESTHLFGEDLHSVTDTIEAFLQESTSEAPVEAVLDLPLPSSAFTTRELEILGLVSSGKHNKEIATELGVSVHTVDRHLANIFGKIGAHNRVEAATFAFTHGLTPHKV